MSFSTKPKKIYTEATLYEYAVGALGRRMRTVAELKRLLRTKAGAGESEAAMIEAVILKLKDQKYLNDSRYAATYSRLRQENERFGKRRVITDLKVKGVHGEIIETAVEQAYANVSEEQLARRFLERKRLRKPNTQKDAARVMRTLLRAGFSLNIIYKLLKKWDVEEDVLNALESEAELEN